VDLAWDRGRDIDECIAIAKAYEEGLGYAPIPDAGFADDVRAAIDAHREPLDLPEWH
jgi:hypothetical protein